MAGLLGVGPLMPEQGCIAIARTPPYVMPGSSSGWIA
jgi:hypothetical protein